MLSKEERHEIWAEGYRAKVLRRTGRRLGEGFELGWGGVRGAMAREMEGRREREREREGGGEGGGEGGRWDWYWGKGGGVSGGGGRALWWESVVVAKMHVHGDGIWR